MTANPRWGLPELLRGVFQLQSPPPHKIQHEPPPAVVAFFVCFLFEKERSRTNSIMPDFGVPNEDDSYVEPDASTSHLNESSNKATEMSSSQEPVRDEVKEIENLAKKDTNWIKGWRLLLIVCLAATATCVTVVTYRFLTEERHEAYKSSVREHHFFVAKGQIVQPKN